MRVILDTNIFISALLSKHEESTVKRIVRACLLQSDIILIFPTELKAEILSVWERKKPLQKLISRQELDSVLEQIEQIAEVPNPIKEITIHTRDPKDDYLIAYGLLEQVDYLVSGDKDLTVLEQIEGLQILSPVKFIEILEPKE